MKPEFIETILDSVADGVFTVDRQWRITSWNHAAETITGFAREQAVGRRCYDVFRTNRCQSECLLRRTMETGENMINLPVTILARDGRERPISVSTAVLRRADGQAMGGVETFRDLSALDRLRRRLRREYAFQDIVSKSPRLLELFGVLPDIAESGSTVLIQGPSGSGKELVARALHNLSPRRKEPFVAVNCGALPDTLLESELFGYRAGAFTDARRDKPGRLATAAGGTLFLDEIADLSAALQVKLLRVLQDKTYEPLGANRPVRADVRVVAAANRDLRAQMALGRFREDLYYRLNVVRLELPPLRERREDIPLLAEHFVERFNAEKGRLVEGLTPAALAALLAYDFPGNVRELENAIEHAFVLGRGAWLDLPHLPPEIAARGPTPAAAADPARGPLAAALAEALRQALARHDGHRARTAAALGMHKTTLLRKMKKLGVTYP